VANADLTDTPWSLGILDESGKLVGKPCKSGRVCNAQWILDSGRTPFFSAVIGIAPAPADESTVTGQLLQTVLDRAPMLNVQVRSAPAQPNRLLWGVDSCKAFTGDAAASTGLYPQVNGILGKPDFWGRYLTDTPNCPGISGAEVAAAASRHMGILPIFNHYDCSAVAGYDTGIGYADEATAAAARLGIAKGSVLVIDIEPPGAWCSGGIDGPFVEGWHDGVASAGYAPGYYGDGTGPSTFGQAWCAAVGDRPEIANGSYLWSFEPSLLGSYTKARSPQWMPNQVGCAGNMVAWQYELSAGANPDVDHDQALAKLPLWYP
jgi:glycoside hydrolase-like protein